MLAKGDYGLTGTFYSNSKKKLGVFRIMYREIGNHGELALSNLLSYENKIVYR